MELIIQDIDTLKKQFGNKNIDKLRKQFGYVKSEYDDPVLNDYHDNRIFLNILHEVMTFYSTEYADFFTAKSELTAECILYNLYYWNHLFIERAKILALDTTGEEDWQFHILEQIDYCGNIDCSLLEKIDNHEYS